MTSARGREQKFGRCQNTFWLAANRKGPEKPATDSKPTEPSSSCYYHMNVPSKL
jgi:hypothetical protein